MAEWLRKFDAHLKTLDGVRTRTLSGAVLTVASTCVIVLLCFSELVVFASVRTVHHMGIDPAHPQHETVRIQLQVEFPHVGCDRARFGVEATRGESALAPEAHIVETPVGEVGCSLQGEVTVGKVGGNFHVSAGQPGGPLGAGGLFATAGSLHEFQALNLSHTVHHLAFGEDFPGLNNPLEHVVNVVPADVGQYQFHIKVIPTVYKRLRRKPIFTFQYSLTEQFVKMDLLSALRATNAPGVFFYFDFYPVLVEYHEEKPSVLQFLTRICGIVGGVFTVSSLLDGILHRANEQMKKSV